MKQSPLFFLSFSFFSFTFKKKKNVSRFDPLPYPRCAPTPRAPSNPREGTLPAQISHDFQPLNSAKSLRSALSSLTSAKENNIAPCFPPQRCIAELNSPRCLSRAALKVNQFHDSSNTKLPSVWATPKIPANHLCLLLTLGLEKLYLCR